MSKTVSARIPNELHQDLRERCNQLGCTINEFVEHCIEFLMYNSSDFDFGDEPENEPKISISEPTEQKPSVVIHD